MKTKKITTAKKGRDAVIIDDRFTVVLRSDGTYNVIDDISNGFECPDQSGIEPFVEAFEKWHKEKQKKIEKEKEESRLAEEKRVQELKEKILNCETPVELAREFGIIIVETARHWSDLYEGRSSYAFSIDTLADLEVIELAIKLYDLKGEWCELKNRAGEHHWTCASQFDLQSWQQNILNYFQGDNYFFKSQETDHDYYLEKIKNAESIDEIKDFIKEYDEIEEGYYYCDGSIAISNADLSKKDFLYFSEDVYSYNFGYRLQHKDSWQEKTEIETEEDE